MPQPPILEPLDMKALHGAGKTWDAWIADAESRENAEKMTALRDSLAPEPAVEAVLKALPRDVHVIAIAEDWCGDVHRHAPTLQKMADVAGGRLHVRFVAREDSRELFKRFLTNGGEAIPKFVFFNDEFVECGNWGPMPAECRRLIARGKAAGDVGAARKRVGAMYESDPAQEVVFRELLDLIEIAVCTTP